jgi:hypothetical protein
MRTYVIVGLAAAGLMGCGRPPATQQATVATTPADNAERPLTLVGCLVPDRASPQRGTARSSDTPQPPGFTLVDVTAAAPGGVTQTGVSGTSGTGVVATGAPRSYSLVADTDRLDDLQRFANSRVEVSGLIVASTGTGASDAGAASAPVSGPPGDVRRMRVKDVRQLERTCGAPKEQ